MATVFEISGRLAMYRKPYTTTSSASFPIPPPTAVAGLLAAILGIGNGSAQDAASAAYWPQLAGTRVAIQRLNRGEWFSATTNFVNLKDPNKSLHILVKHQFVRDPRYRISVAGGVEEALDRRLAAGEFIFTPTLGVAYAIADLRYLGRFPEQDLPAGQWVELPGALPLPDPEHPPQIDYLRTQGLMKDTFPYRLDVDRRLLETITLLYPSAPEKRIVLKVTERSHVNLVNGTPTAWLPAW